MSVNLNWISAGNLEALKQEGARLYEAVSLFFIMKTKYMRWTTAARI